MRLLPCSDLTTHSHIRFATDVSDTSNTFHAINKSNQQSSPGWGYKKLWGRLTEISGIGPVASVTAAVGLIREAQRQGELVAWISSSQGTFFPPDVVNHGVDIEALAVIRAPDGLGAARVASHLIRSRAFGLVIIDLTNSQTARISMALQNRLASLAHKNEVAVVGITKSAAALPSIGSMVSLRVEFVRQKTGFDQFHCHMNVLKDKRYGQGWKHMEVMCGPTGLH